METHKRRPSAFREIGLEEDFVDEPDRIEKLTKRERRPQSVRFRSQDEVHVVDRYRADEGERQSRARRRSAATSRDDIAAQIPTPKPGPTKGGSVMHRLGVTLFLVAVAVPLLRTTSLFDNTAALPIQPAEAGVIRPEAASRTGPDLSKRSDSPTDICFRWAQQSAIVNGTLYLYGGQATTEVGQTENTWNNDFLAMDLTKDWDIAAPALTGLAQPSGPPAVALGALWNTYDSLFLYGGEFSWKPPVDPTPLSVWEYQIQSQSWVEHQNPTTSSGTNAPDNNVAVQRAAEGASASVPSLGRAFYFGGHQDGYTTPGWSQSIARIYLQSLLEFTFPGYTNPQVNALGNGQTAGDDGIYRNITQGGLQSSAGFTERADGLLIYIPGFGDQGILLALSGGTNQTFTQMNVLDVYDIATSAWYRQSTSGSTPEIRVNPCAVVGAAPDGSSYNIYMFGGQNLTPYGNQSQFDDMWILTVPAFTWIQVDQSGQSVPPGRSGHTCNVWDAQMVVVGGYVGNELSCDSPGIYVYDMSKTQWVQQFTALSPGSDTGSSGSGSSTSNSQSSSGGNFKSTGSNNPLNQQPAQLANGSSSGGLAGSYGYSVPQIVIDVVGGDSSGGATVTAPVVTATSGPLATGKPITYTVTNSNGATVTETSTPGGGSSSSSSNNNNNGGGSSNGKGGSSSSGKNSGGPNIAAIVVGVVCGILFVIACYLAFCAYVYRRQLQLYKRHVEMSQAQARGEKVPAIPGLLATDSSSNGGKRSDERREWNGMAWVDSSSGHGTGYAGSGSGRFAVGGGSGNGSGYQELPRRSSESSDSRDLLDGREPTFVGVMLNPRRSLRVINRD